MKVLPNARNLNQIVRLKWQSVMPTWCLENSAKVGNTTMYLIVKLFLETERRWLRWATSTSWALRRRSYDLSKWRSFWVKTNSIAEAANNSAEEKSRSRSTSKFSLFFLFLFFFFFFFFFCEKTFFSKRRSFMITW